MRNNKTNPRRVPKTLADVERAEDAGRVEGAQFALTCIIWILCDKHDAPEDDVKQLSREIKYLFESIAEGNVSFPEVKRALKEEYDWTVDFYIEEGNVNGK